MLNHIKNLVTTPKSMTNASEGKFYPEISTLCVTSTNTDLEITVDKKAIQNLPSKRGAGTRDEGPQTINHKPSYAPS